MKHVWKVWKEGLGREGQGEYGRHVVATGLMRLWVTVDSIILAFSWPFLVLAILSNILIDRRATLKFVILTLQNHDLKLVKSCDATRIHASRFERMLLITCCAKLFLAPASRVPANVVFLVLLMFLIFERPIQILFRIHLVSVIKCYVRLNKLG